MHIITLEAENEAGIVFPNAVRKKPRRYLVSDIVWVPIEYPDEVWVEVQRFRINNDSTAVLSERTLHWPHRIYNMLTVTVNGAYERTSASTLWLCLPRVRDKDLGDGTKIRNEIGLHGYFLERTPNWRHLKAEESCLWAEVLAQRKAIPSSSMFDTKSAL